MTKILALSGKKQSGKSTTGNFLLGLKMVDLGIIHGMDITPKGELQIYDLWNDTSCEGVWQYHANTQAAKDWHDDNVHPWYKIYSFADLLKRSVCIELLGLSEEQCFGTDEQKNSVTHLRWEDMPGVLSNRHDHLYQCIEEARAELTPEEFEQCGYDKFTLHEPGHMTGREVMQFVGTEIFRRMYHNVWAQGTVNRILKENSEMAVICDCRFPNEVEAVQKAGGKVIRFTRCVDEADKHPSEISLDGYEGFDYIIDNRNMPIGQQNELVYRKLREWGYPLLDLDGLQ